MLKVDRFLEPQSIFEVIFDLLQGPTAQAPLEVAIWTAPGSVHNADIDLRSIAHLFTQTVAHGRDEIKLISMPDNENSLRLAEW